MVQSCPGAHHCQPRAVVQDHPHLHLVPIALADVGSFLAEWGGVLPFQVHLDDIDLAEDDAYAYAAVDETD